MRNHYYAVHRQDEFGLKIGLLICGKLPSAIERRGISHARLIEDWLGPNVKGGDFRTYRAFTGKMPPKINSCDCYFVSGSASSMLDQQPWQQELSNFLLVAAKAQVPVIGLCFGHQALAQALGGRVAKAPKGWELGIKSWKVIREEGWMRECGKKLTLPSIHRDQVVKLPPRSMRVASSERCANGLFRLANHAIGIQGHPEFPPEILGELIEIHTDLFDAKEKANALASLDQPTDAKDMSRWCANFVTVHAS